MNHKMDERLPQVVEDRLQEAYEAIRKGEVKQVKQMEKYKNRNKRWMSVAAAIIILVSVPSVVFAAMTYFQKSAQRREDQITYEFVLNYELRPYTRQHYKDGALLSEEKAEQKILRVDIDVHCYERQEGEVPLNFDLEYVEQKPDGAYTWRKDYYTSVPE
ncbi:hypothetical protein [Parablautia muri]|uniref:DUF4179 domain-containing protein n=1 Tax=Parablautia muri TaxID=2320879 RepID=A0A9X5BHU8_9FIRM|nr:hypothetical protein [Parablautia muri]NBJ94309.1 hypothetical protein [Parablautia muri]